MNNNYLKIIPVIVLFVLMNSFFIITETEQAIKTEFGKPVGDTIVN